MTLNVIVTDSKFMQLPSVHAHGTSEQSCTGRILYCSCIDYISMVCKHVLFVIDDHAYYPMIVTLILLVYIILILFVYTQQMSN